MAGNPQDPSDPSRGAPPTDPFARIEPHQRASQIPVTREVPETREEVQQRRVTRIVVGVTLCILAGLSAWGIRSWLRTSGIESAVHEYDSTGTEAALAEATRVLAGASGEDELGLLARVLAAGVLDVSPRDMERAVAIAEEAGESEDARIARAYLALAQYRPAQAAEFANKVIPAGDSAAEAHRVRALASMAIGNLAVARQESEAAAQAMPESPRHAALLAVVLSRIGEGDAARKALAPFTATSNVARVALARTHAFEARWREARDAVASTSGAPPATDVDNAWASLIAARAFLEVDARPGAAQKALQSAGRLDVVRGDEVFALLLADTFVLAGDPRAAREDVLAKLPADTTTMPTWRLETEFRTALAQKDTKRADEIEPRLVATPAAQLLRAEWHDAGQRAPKAREAYASLLADPVLGREARIRLAALELRVGRAKQAGDAIEPLAKAEPTEPRIVSIAALAFGMRGEAARAFALLDAAMKAKPDDVSLVVARARVELSTKAWEPALASLTRAMAKGESDPDIFAMAGDAARALGRQAEARAHYEKALAVVPAHGGALVGMLSLADDRRDLADARAWAGKLAAAGVSSEEADRALAFYWVLESAGAEGVLKVQRLMDKPKGLGRKDGQLWLARALLHYQAEEHGPAARSFGIANSNLPGDLRTVVYRTFPQVELRLRAPAKHSVELAEETAAAATAPLSQEVRALIRAARARYELSQNHVAQAQKKAEAALELDSKLSEAHLVLADLLLLRSRPAIKELRRASEAPAATPRAWAKLALALGDTGEACELAARYRRAAPKGTLIPALRKFPLECR
jgi:Tfp pilus assembly protein PilF